MDRIEVKVAFTVDDEGTIEGIAWPFGSADRIGDEILPGSFKGVTGPLPMMAFHEQKETVGVWESIAETAQGLVVKGRLLINEVVRAKEILALVKAKALPALSIGFATKKAAPRKGGGRTISALDLLEISIVAVGMHPGAKITAAKGAQPGKESVMDNENGAAPEIAALETKIGEVAEAVKGFPAIITRLDKLEAKTNRPATDTDKAEPSEERKAFTAYLRRGDKAGADDLKALTVSNDEMGGYLAPSEFQTEVIKGIVERSPIRQAARVSSTSAGEVILPKRTGRPTGYWVGETETRTETGSTYGQVEVPIHEMACYVDVSLKLLEDSAVNVESEVAFDLAEEFGRLEAAALMDGDGVKKPKGVMAYTDVAYSFTGNGSTLGSAPADLLIDAFYEVPAYYRNRGVWMMNGSTLAAIRKLKDAGSGAYLWQPALTAGQPETILGRPVIEDPTMDDVGSAAEPIIFGDFNAAYRVFDRVGMSIFADPYTQRTAGKVRFHARRRVGAGMTLAEALRKIRCATS
jgi:HK97 family phage major capsid protein/HK97 family phage prohead protease